MRPADWAPPLVSVVVATHNRRDLLKRTLGDLAHQSHPAVALETVVVIDGSTDGTAAMLRTLRVPWRLRVIEQTHRGAAAARNAGLRAANGDLVLLLDDDLRFGPTLLAEHVAAHASLAAREPDCRALVAGPVVVDPASPRGIATEWSRRHTAAYLARLERDPRPRWPEDALVDANSSVRRQALLDAGGFDERLGSQRETAELGLRLWRSGVRWEYAPRALVRHLYVKRVGDVGGKDAARYGRSEVLLCRAHPLVRPHSALARIGRQPVVGGAIVALAARSWFPAEAPALAVARAAERVGSGTSPTARLGTAVGLAALRAAQGMATMRGAVSTAGSWPRVREEFRHRLPVLLYHHVGPRPPGTYPELTLSAAQFARHLSWLTRWGFTGICPSDWVTWCLEGRPLPPRPVLITFDDAYAGVAECALPLLRRYRFGAGVFAVSDLTGGTNEWDERRGAGTHRLMTAAQLRLCAESGLEIGAHGRTHADLERIDASGVEDEVAGSRAALERTIGREVRAFAYPYRYARRGDAAADRAVRRAYDLAFTTDEGTNHLATDLHRLRRTMVQPSDGPFDLWCRLRLGWSPLSRLRAVTGTALPQMRG